MNINMIRKMEISCKKKDCTEKAEVYYKTEPWDGEFFLCINHASVILDFIYKFMKEEPESKSEPCKILTEDPTKCTKGAKCSSHMCSYERNNAYFSGLNKK